MLLLGLGGAAYWGGDPQTGQVIWAMMLLAVGMQTAQEVRGERAAASLKCALASSCRVLRGSDGTELVHVDVKGLVPGDVCHVAAGDVVPADGVLIESNFLQVNQSRLTGESACVRKYANTKKASSDLLTLDMSPDDPGTLLTSSTVVSGSGYFRVVHTGDCTELGKTMGALNNIREPSRFDKDMQAFTWMMIRFIFVLAPLVALVQLLKQGWCMDAFMYAVSVSVGLAPEMMPMIITTCLVHGASVLSRRYKVIVKRINAMQALGTVSVLCTDKTGTLTCDCLSVHRSLDAQGAVNTQEADLCLTLAKLNAHFQDDGSNSIDTATRASAMASFPVCLELVSLVDRVPFDFEKRTAVVRVRFRGDLQGAPRGAPSALARLARPGMDLVILKGAAEETIALCDELGRESGADEGKPNVCKAQALKKALARCAGERLLGVAIGYVNSSSAGRPHVQDQIALSLAGFVSFTDPPKASARASIASMLDLGVAVKMLTGDSASVAALVAEQVGIPSASSVITGPALDRMDEASFREALAQCTVFAKLTPQNKFRIISELKHVGCDTAMLGDGVNDVAALQVADVGISVDSACDASRSAADILLTEKDLAVLRPCVLAGRRVFANMVKYLKMAASSNFGNMFSVVGASLFVPFIPMLPLQVVLSNFLYDFAQLGIPSDAVDEELLTEPLRLNVDGLQRFIVAVGWISSFFDCMTFAVMYFVLGGDATNPALFQTGWFVEGLLSQTLIVYVLRSRKPFNWLRRYMCVNALDSDPRVVYRRSESYAAPSPLLNALSLCVCLSGVYLARAPRFRKMLKFSTLPASYWAWLTLILASYMFATYVVIDRVAGNQKLFSRKGRSKRYHLRASGVVASTV